MVVVEKCVGGQGNDCKSDEEINKLFEFPGFNMELIFVT